MSMADEDVVGFLLTSSLSCGAHPSPEELQEALSHIVDNNNSNDNEEDDAELAAIECDHQVNNPSALASPKDDEIILSTSDTLSKSFSSEDNPINELHPELEVTQEPYPDPEPDPDPEPEPEPEPEPYHEPEHEVPQTPDREPEPEPEVKSPTRPLSPARTNPSTPIHSSAKTRMAYSGRHIPRLHGINAIKYPVVGGYPARVSTPEELAAIARVYSSTPDFPRTPPPSPATPMLYPPTPPSPPPSPLDSPAFMPQFMMVQDLERKLAQALTLAEERAQEALAVREKSELEASELKKSLLDLQDRLLREEQRRHEEEENLRKDLQAREDLLKEQELRAASMQQELMQLRALLIEQQQLQHQHHPTSPHANSSQLSHKNVSHSSSMSPITSGSPSPFTSPLLAPTPPPSICTSPYVGPIPPPNFVPANTALELEESVPVPNMPHSDLPSQSLPATVAPLNLDRPTSPLSASISSEQLRSLKTVFLSNYFV